MKSAASQPSGGGRNRAKYEGKLDFFDNGPIHLENFDNGQFLYVEISEWFLHQFNIHEYLVPDSRVS